MQTKRKEQTRMFLFFFTYTFKVQVVYEDYVNENNFFAARLKLRFCIMWAT